MSTSTARDRRRGSRRERPIDPKLERPVQAQGFSERLLTFESFTGFQHDSIGLLAGVAHAAGLLLWRAQASRARARGARRKAD